MITCTCIYAIYFCCNKCCTTIAKVSHQYAVLLVFQMCLTNTMPLRSKQANRLPASKAICHSYVTIPGKRYYFFNAATL